MSMQSLLRLLTLMPLHLEPQAAAELATSIQLKAQNLGTISIPPTIAKGGTHYTLSVSVTVEPL
jgi:hypothetical protein